MNLAKTLSPLVGFRRLAKTTAFLVGAVVLLFLMVTVNYTSLNNISSPVYTGKGRELHVPRCNCSKLVPPASWPFQHELDNGRFREHNTTCDNSTFVRGFGQKVIGFTFYEPKDGDTDFMSKKNRMFFDGIKENLELIKKYYPGWIMRLYYKITDDSSQVMKDLCEVACSDPHIDICDVERNPRLGNASILYPIVWRFLPVIDVQVDRFLSRDLDSRINPREVASVEEFLHSDKTIHIMRDHPAHVAYMMGGTWGAKVDKERANFFASFKKMFQDGLAYVNPDQGGGWDQIALLRFVYPWAKKTALAHDSYHCKKFPNTSPFPVQRQEGIGNYVGSVVTLNATLGLSEGSICPEKCRPKNHKDWIYC